MFFYGGLLGGILTAVIIFKKMPQYRYLLDYITGSRKYNMIINRIKA
jgi:prolipoprotein diacylglyceryltransferase